MGSILSSIGAVVEALRLVKWFYQEIQKLIKEANDREAEERAQKLKDAIDLMKEAETDEERTNARREIIRRSRLTNGN